MFFSLSNDGIEWCFDFGPVSVTLTVKDLIQQKTTSAQEIPLATWSLLLLSIKQDILNKHLAKVSITPSHQWTMALGHEVLSKVGAKDMNTRGYQVSDLRNFELHWEGLDFNMDAAFRPGIDIPFWPSNFNDFDLRSMTENPIPIDDDQDKENSPPVPTFPISERPPESLC